MSSAGDGWGEGGSMDDGGGPPPYPIHLPTPCSPTWHRLFWPQTQNHRGRSTSSVFSYTSVACESEHRCTRPMDAMDARWHPYVSASSRWRPPSRMVCVGNGVEFCCSAQARTGDLGVSSGRHLTRRLDVRMPLWLWRHPYTVRFSMQQR